MVVGPFGIAAGAKAWAPAVPLWALVVAAQLLDILFLLLRLVGIETDRPAAAAHPLAYGGHLLQDSYSHALVSALLLAAVAGLVGRAVWDRRSGWVIAGVVFAHWVLDLLLQRADLAILPGNAGNLPLLGLGLWQQPMISEIVEAVLVLSGALLYYRAALRLPAPSIRSSGEYRVRAITAALVTSGLLVLALVVTVLGLF
ncbi:MAG TPA: permease [Chloroflexia bacterium]|nr:permease [Chloroflexia bacterium]